MNQIQIITDAGSDIVDCSRTDLTVLPMTIRFGDEEYLDGVNLTHRQFYEKMIETQVLPTTSQPSPYAFEAAIRKIHEQGDIALIITISSKLSGTWQSANIAAAETGGEVYIVDSLNVAVGEKAIVEYALRMKDAGTDIHTIVETLNHEKENLSDRSFGYPGISAKRRQNFQNRCHRRKPAFHQAGGLRCGW